MVHGARGSKRGRGSARHTRAAKLPRYPEATTVQHGPLLLSLSVSDCSSLLPASRIAEIDHAIATHPVTLLGMAHMRCTDAALQRLEGVSACVHTISWTDASDPLWAYLQCKHPHEIVNGMQMHSYVYIGGSFVGNGSSCCRTRWATPTSPRGLRRRARRVPARLLRNRTSLRDRAPRGDEASAARPPWVDVVPVHQHTLRSPLSRPTARASSRRCGPRTRRRSTSTSSASTAASTTRSSSSAASSSATASRCRPTG